MVIRPKQLEEDEDTHPISTIAQTNMTISATHSNLVGALCARPNTICVAMKAMSPPAKIRWRCSANQVMPKLLSRANQRRCDGHHKFSDDYGTTGELGYKT